MHRSSRVDAVHELEEMMRLIIAITGASGVAYAKRLLQVLREKNVETHLLVSRNGRKVISTEDGNIEEYSKLAAFVHQEDDLGAPITSGSFAVDGMVIVPCSTSTLSAIAHGISDNCIRRAAEVTLKERRPLVVVPRETPLTTIHIQSMMQLSLAGAIILPAMPAFYFAPKGIGDLIDYVVGKILDVLKVSHNLFRRWSESNERS